MFDFNPTQLLGIKKGAITTAFKAWDALEVQPYDVIYSDSDGSLQVVSTGWVTASQIGKREVVSCGFNNHQQLFAALTQENSSFDPISDKVVRITFRFVKR